MALRFLNSGYFAGKVGIGTESPDSKLEVSQQLSAASTIDYPYTISSRDDGNSINQAGGEGVGIKFRIAGNAATTPGDSLVGASIAAIRESGSDTDSSTGLGFFITQNDETLDEALRIDHDGNVGIGTDDPVAKLHVDGTAIFDTQTGAQPFYITRDGAANQALKIYVDDAAAIFESIQDETADNYGAFQFILDAGVTEPYFDVRKGAALANTLFRVDGNGNVGIGETNPAYKLHVGGAVYSSSTIGNLTAGSLGQQMELGDAAVATFRFDANRWRLYAGASAGEVFTVEETGNVGINNTGPDYKLEVNGTFGVSDLPFNTDSVSVLVADETIGTELITNGNFATDSDWSKGAGWTISGGTANAVSATSTPMAQTVSGFAAGNIYKVRFEVTAVTNGYIRVYAYVGASGTFTNIFSSPELTTGVYEGTFEFGGTNKILRFYGSTGGVGGFAGSIDNVSVKQVTSASNQIQKRELGTGAFGPTPVGAYLPLAGGTMTGNIDFVNNKDISMTDNAGAVTRVMVLNTSNTMYIGPVDTYAGGSILYGVAAGVSFQRFFTGASERLRIGSNGNVAIGTTATSYRLQVEQNNNGNLLSRFHNTAANGQGLLIRAGGVSSANRILQLASENDTKVMTVNSNGRVGIGIANPTQKLEVVGNVLITAALLSNQENTDIDTGAEVVAQVSHATYTAAFFDFVVKKGTNVRSGTVYACHNGDTTPLVEFTETSTNDLGDTSDVTLSVDISGTNMRLLATVTSDDWSVKSLIRAI